MSNQETLNDAKSLTITMGAVCLFIAVVIVLLYGWVALILACLGGFSFLVACVGLSNVTALMGENEDAR